MSSGKVKCTCGWSWNKSDSSKKDMYICHECGRDNSNNMKNGGWLDNYGEQDNYNDSQASAPEGMVGDGYSNVGRNYSPAWGGQFEDGGEIPMAQKGKKVKYVESKNDPRYKAYQDSLMLHNATKDYYKHIKESSGKNLTKDQKKKLTDEFFKADRDIYNYQKSNDYYNKKGDWTIGKDIEPIREGVLSLHGNNYRVGNNNAEELGFSYYKKPQQQVIVKPTTTKETTKPSSGYILQADGSKFYDKSIPADKFLDYSNHTGDGALSYKDIPQDRKPVKAIQNNLHPVGLEQGDFNIDADVSGLHPGARRAKYFDVRDIVNQNFGGSDTSYRWNPENGPLPEIAPEPYNTRKITPHYQMGGSVYPVNYVPQAQNGFDAKAFQKTLDDKFAKDKQSRSKKSSNVKLKDTRNAVVDETSTKPVVNEKLLLKELKQVNDNQQKIEDAKDYYKQYLNSPKARERISNMIDYRSDPEYDRLFPEEKNSVVDQEIKNRLEGLNKLKGKFDYIDDVGTYSSSYYEPKTNSLFVRPNSDANISFVNGDENEWNNKIDVSNTIGHEIGHAIGRHSNKDSNNIWYSNGISKKESDLLMNANIGLMRSKNRDEVLKDRNNPEYTYDLDHDNRPSELKADIDALRYQLYRQGVYDPGTQDFTREHLEKAKPSFTRNRLNEHFNDDELIDLMNKLSYNETNDDGITPIAQMGASVPGAVGFSYARTQGAAPSNGKYAKKTMASAQNGSWLSKYDVAQDGDILDKFRESHPSIRSIQNDAMNRKIQQSKGRGKETTVTQKDNTRTVTPKEIKKLSGKQQNELAQRQSEQQAAKDWVQGSMEEAYKSPLMSPGYFTPEGMAVGALQGAFKMPGHVAEGNTWGVIGDAAMMLPFAKPAAKTLGRVLGPEEGLMGKVSQEVNINRNLSKIKKEGQLQGLSDYEIAKKQMEEVGITSNQRKAYTPLASEFAEKYIKPRNYTGTTDYSQKSMPTKNKFQEIIENIKKGGYKEAYPERIDAWKLYLGRPQVRKTFNLADTAPALHPSYKPGSLEGMDIYNINSRGVKSRIGYNDTYTPGTSGHLDVLESPMSIDRDPAIMGGYNKILTKEGTQYNDIWDLEPGVNLKSFFPNAISENSRFENIFYKTLPSGVQSPRGFKIPVEKFVGKPFMSHGNLPYTSTQHVNLLKESILSEIEKFKPQVNTAFEGPERIVKMQADLKNLENYPKYEQGGIIKDDRGQWDHPGEITEIGSNDITMEGVPYDVLGISDTGDTKLMKPGKNYKFKGKKVTEYPMAKNGLRQEQKGLQNLDNLTNFTNYNKPQPGGWLNKYN